MHYAIISRILGILLMLFSITMLIPMLVSLYYQDHAYPAFLAAFSITFCSGLIMWLPFWRTQGDLRHRDGFMVTSLFWIVLGLFGSLPFMLAEQPHLSISNAVFESISGLTTTGATVITGLDDLPKSILYYRQQLQWFGGIGIIVIAVAILPILGIGGMQLYRAETPGPIKDRKLTPRITETAKWLFFIYLGLTAACALAYWLAGMTLFDAIGHSYSTVAIGGFSTHDASMGYFNDKPMIVLIASAFMFISGINFALHFICWNTRQIKHYLNDPECVFYTVLMLSGIFIVCGFLFFTHQYDSISDTFIHGLFQVVSIATTTGFATTDFSSWPSFVPFFLLLMAFVGGCGSSTGGGIKVIRVMLIFKQGIRELQQLIHPHAIIPVKIKRNSVSSRVLAAVWSFFAIYIICFTVILMVLLAFGLDYVTAFSATSATLNNLGPGLGEVALNYDSIPATTKWVLCLAMLLGRLEIFTLLVLLTPEFWRR